MLENTQYEYLEASLGAKEDAAGAPQLQDPANDGVQEPVTTPKVHEEDIYTLFTPAQPRAPSQVRSISQVDSKAPSDDSSSCEYVAHIITSMRADLRTDDVRAEMGRVHDIGEW